QRTDTEFESQRKTKKCGEGNQTPQVDVWVNLLSQPERWICAQFKSQSANRMLDDCLNVCAHSFAGTALPVDDQLLPHFRSKLWGKIASEAGTAVPAPLVGFFGITPELSPERIAMCCRLAHREFAKFSLISHAPRKLDQEHN